LFLLSGNAFYHLYQRKRETKKKERERERGREKRRERPLVTAKSAVVYL
jgi:hypothetical protein